MDDDDRVVDDRVLDALSRKIRAEMAREAIEREGVEETRRLRIAKERQARLLLEIVQKYANLGEQVAGLVELLQNRLETNVIYDIIREWFEDMGREVDLINERIRLIAELIRMVVPAAQRGQIQSILDEPEIDLDRKKKLRLWRQIRELEKLAGETGDVRLLAMIDQIMAEIAEVQPKRTDSSSE